MATQISNKDIQKVKGLLTEALGENHRSLSFTDEFLTEDNWNILIGGWRLQPGWSRGFMVTDNMSTSHNKHRGHTSPKHDEGRYEGRGWHQRMADDIVKAVEACRAGVVSAPAIIHVADESAS